jgi:hypothetical protein
MRDPEEGNEFCRLMIEATYSLGGSSLTVEATVQL